MGLAADGDLPKRLGKSIRLVLPVKAGEVFVAGKVTRQDILKTLEAMSG